MSARSTLSISAFIPCVGGVVLVMPGNIEPTVRPLGGWLWAALPGDEAGAFSGLGVCRPPAPPLQFIPTT